MNSPDNRGYVGLSCPNCSHARAHVIDTNMRDGGLARRRRNECKSCKFHFTTYEVLAEEYEKMLTMRVDAKEFESVISQLRAIKAQFGGSANGNNNRDRN
jgi:transcriptional regulator NrdR family protein